MLSFSSLMLYFTQLISDYNERINLYIFKVKILNLYPLIDIK